MVPIPESASGATQATEATEAHRLGWLGLVLWVVRRRRLTRVRVACASKGEPGPRVNVMEMSPRLRFWSSLVGGRLDDYRGVRRVCACLTERYQPSSITPAGAGITSAPLQEKTKILQQSTLCCQYFFF